MKALVLSGGTATRLRPLSYHMPKQLIPVANKPVLEHVLENIAALGLTEVAIVVGDWAERIEKVIGDGARFGLQVNYLRQPEPRGLAHCVQLASPFLGDDDFLMYLGDTILPDGIEDVAAVFRRSRPAALVSTYQVPDARAFGVVERDQHGRVRRLIEKPTQPGSGQALIGVYFFTSAVHEAVSAITPSGRGELEITDAIQWLLTRGAGVDALEYRGYWKDTGTAADILACNRELLRRLTPVIGGEVDATSEIGPQVVIEPGARVLRSRIKGPSIIGANALVSDSRIGPHTAIGRDCVIRGAEVVDSIVVSGAAELTGCRLSGALVGPDR